MKKDMNINKYMFVVLILTSSATLFGQVNIFSIADNGDFEQVGSENDMGQTSPFHYTQPWNLLRSSEVPAFSGEYSLKCTSVVGNGYKALFSVGFDEFEAGKSYIVKARIRVPSDSGIPVGRWISIGVDRDFETGSTQVQGCSANNKSFYIGDDPYDEWVEVYNFVTHSLAEQHTMYLFLFFSHPVGTFYVDKLEVFEHTPLQATADVDNVNRNITLHPTGGVSNVPYNYSWSDGFVEKDRINLPYGTYSVVINQQMIQPYLCPTTDGSEQLSFTFTQEPVVPLCTMIIPKGLPGQLKLDKFSGRVVFQPDNECADNIPLGCIGGRVDAPQLENVVSASALTFNDRWEYDATMFNNLGAPVSFNPYESGMRGKWRPEASYVFSTGSIIRDKNYNTGTFTLSHFNWQHPDVNQRTGWLLTNKVEKYSPHGEPLEERNAIGIPSAAKFGYHDAVPYLIAQNAEYNSVMFESFENLYASSSFEDGFSINGSVSPAAGIAHSGQLSLLFNGATEMLLRAFRINAQIKSHGMLTRLWVRSSSPDPSLELHMKSENTTLGSVVFTRIAQTGEWSLFEAVIQASSFASIPFSPATPEPARNTFTLHLTHTAAGQVWIDDLRVQPKDAEMTAYVYDTNTLRLLTVFDDQHFGLFYQYNAEGKLVRKIIETERGVRTIQETQYNTPVVSKASVTGN